MGVYDLLPDKEEYRPEGETPADKVEDKAKRGELLSTEDLEKLNLYFVPTPQGEVLKEKDKESALAHCYSPELVKQLLRVDYEEVERAE